MKSFIVENGRRSLGATEEMQTRLVELKKSIQSRYDVEFAGAGFFRRILIRRRIAAEFQRERSAIEPSLRSLFVR